MPFMYCNHSGCNETVKLPAQYCAKHQPAKLSESVTAKAKDLTLKIDTSNAVREVLEDKGLLDLIEPKGNTKKTTK